MINFLTFLEHITILYIKAIVVYVCLSICLSVVTNRAGQGQGSRCRLGVVPLLLKKSLGKTEGPVSNQTKIQIKKYIFSL
jgi:hypothetical protein